MTVITMSRQFGSGAAEIANKLCQALGLVAFDKRLIAQVAHEIGLSDQEIVDYSEDHYKQRGFFDLLFRRSRTITEVSSWTGGGLSGYERQTLTLDEEHAIRLVRSAILAAYERDNVLIVGRGGQAILENKPGVLHVRVVAPFEQRIQRVMQEQGVSPAQARRLLQEHDEATRQYLRQFHHVDVDDPTLYDIVVNTARLNADQCVELIKAAAQAIAQAPAESA